MQEQHRNFYLEEVLPALVGWARGGMKGESEKHQAAHAGERRCGLRLRCHPAAKGFATGQ
ncbi:MAG: hypothetical protein DMG10_27480 [Acidobacteria bacterium]|nr:MAG: hypothetical protein DMG10_27480 [Acidobacteriota bacterium]